MSASNTCLNLFEKVPVLEPVLWSNVKQTFMVNNIMHSLFSNLEVYFNNEQVYSSSGLYAQKSFLSNEFSAMQGTKDSIPL